jgi:F-type H+-transporting ATPase subunit b
VVITPNQTLIIQIVIFLVLMVVLDRVLFKPMLGLLAERKKRTEGRRAKAEEAGGQAKDIWEDYQTKLAAARSEAEVVRIELIRQGDAERQRLLDAANAEAEKTVATLKAQVAEQADKAKAALVAEVDALSKMMAEKILGRAL